MEEACIVVMGVGGMVEVAVGIRRRRGSLLHRAYGGTRMTDVVVECLGTGFFAGDDWQWGNRTRWGRESHRVVCYLNREVYQEHWGLSQ